MSLPIANTLKLNSRKIYILPTRWGVLYSILLLILLLLAINYKISLAYYLAFLLLALGIVAILHTWLNMIDLDVDTPNTKAVFAGDTAHLKCKVSNLKSQPRYALGAHISKTDIHYQDIAQQATFSVPVQTTQRGWQAIPRLTLSSDYPLGLLRAWAHIPHKTKLLVYPKPSKAQNIAIAIDAGLSDTSNSQTSIQKGEDEFNGHRHYQKGDPIKHIDWKASSKREDILSKEYAADLPEIIWYDWSLVEATDKEERISLLTKAIIDAHTANKTYGLKLPKAGFKPDNTSAHYHACLKALALL